MTKYTKVVPSAEKRKPPNAGKGRKAGVPNKTTATLKEAILQAAAETGFDGKGEKGLLGYLKLVAQSDVKAFAGLLGKVLPLTVTSDPDAPIKVEFTWKQ